MTDAEIKQTLDSLKLGDKLVINDWRAKYTVCGISPNYVLAHYGQHYTILSKQQCSHTRNGVRIGDYYCGPDWWIFGYVYKCNVCYNFTDPDWVGAYLSDLESGNTEISQKKNAPVYFLSVIGHTDRVYQNHKINVKKEKAP